MEETIVAISTSMGEAGIGIVRMTGNESFDIARKIFSSNKNKVEFENKKLYLGKITDGEKMIDEVLISFMKGPFTYSGEDTVEIYCHGGMIPLRLILELCMKKGAVLAQRGEFTKRAFLNGKLSLMKAEAINDIINAKTQKSYELSISQYQGGSESKIRAIMDELLSLSAHIEALIDYPEEDIEEISYAQIEKKLSGIICELSRILEATKSGSILRDGIKTLIIGKPNVGKSSLLNALSRRNRAIVSEIPGTTRDMIEEYIDLDGIPLIVIDTAGIRETLDEVEKMGVNLAIAKIEEADLVIQVFDASSPTDKEDLALLRRLKDKKVIYVINKTDIAQDYSLKYLGIEEEDTVKMQIKYDKGMDELKNKIKELFFNDDIKTDSSDILSGLRQQETVRLAYESVKAALEDSRQKKVYDIIDIGIREGYNKLGELDGSTLSEDVLDKIFSKFCIGK